MNKLERKIEAYIQSRQHDLDRYCAGLQRAAQEMMNEAKAHFERGRDEQAKDRRGIAKQIEHIIAETEKGYEHFTLKEIARFTYDHDEARRIRRHFKKRKGK